MSTFKKRFTSPWPGFTCGSWSRKGTPKVAAASRARPRTARQSGRLGVISKSTHTSSIPSAFTASVPTGHSSSSTRMPSSTAFGKSCVVRPSSDRLHSMPPDSTPRSLPLRISLPPGSFATCSAAGTRSPTFRLFAPVTICTGASRPTSTWHTTIWSESGWGTIYKILPTTTFFMPSASHS